MTEIEINGKTYKLPENPKEITFRKYAEVYQGVSGKKEDAIRDKVTVMGALLGEDERFVKGLPLSIFNDLFEKVGWLFDGSTMEVKQDLTVKVGGEELTLTEPESWTLQKYIDTDTLHSDNTPNGLCRLLAAVLQTDYKSERIDELAKAIGDSPASDMLPLMNHFVAKKKISDEITRISSLIDEMGSLIQEYGRSSESSTGGKGC